MTDSLDHTNWTPPAPPLSIGEIQRGVAPVSFVRNERASDPFDGEFEHWSALPALSYFALNAVTLRESLRRIAPPTTFRPPPRLTLSDQRRQSWLNELKTPSVPLRTLSRAVPHGYTSASLLTMLIENEIPIFRAIWFIKCIGANEVRALKRKTGSSTGPDSAEHRRIESTWLSEWTDSVISVILQVIDSFNDISLDQFDREESYMHDDEEGVSENEHVSETESEHKEHEARVHKKRRHNEDQDEQYLKSGNENNNDNENGNENHRGYDVEANNDPNADINGFDRDTTLSSSNRRDSSISSNNDKDDDDSMNELFGESENSKPESENNDEVYVGAQCTTADAWQKRMEYASRISLGLYNSSLLDRHAFLDWLIEELRNCSPEVLPCFIHFVQLLWKPMTSISIAPKLLRALAHRYRIISSEDTSGAVATIITTHFEPLVFKLMTTNENAFINPRTWPILEPHVRNHPAYSRIATRNQAFLPCDPHDPSDWGQPLAIGALMDNFARPYQLDELMNSFNALEVETDVLVRTLLLRTLRQGTPGSISLCIVLLKRLVSRGNNNKRATISEHCVEFLLDPHLVHGSEWLGALVSELIRSNLCYLDRYINKLISRDILHRSSAGIVANNNMMSETPINDLDTNLRDLHLRVLQDLPFDWLPPNLLTQIYTMLWRAGISVKPVDLEPFVKEGALILTGKQSATLNSSIRELHINDSHRLADRYSSLFEELCSSEATMPSDPSAFARFTELMDIVGCGSVRPLYKVLMTAVSSPYAQPPIVGSALRQVHCRLMAFVCSGLIDPFVKRLLSKLEASTRASTTNNNNRNQNVFQWVSWDSISALRSVIQSPNIMCDLNSVVPLRPTLTSVSVSAGQTPIERDACIRGALYKPGSPDINTLIAMRGDEGLSHDIVEWAQSPSSDLTALLQLLTYHAVSIDELIDAANNKFDLLRFFLLAPSNELGFCLEEVEALRMIRYKYLSQLPLDQLLELTASVPAIQCVSRIAHAYPNLYINHLVIPAMEHPASLELLKKATVAEMRSFEVLLLRCTPFNLRFYQGLVLLAFHGMELEDIADEVLRTAHDHPEASPALQGLLQHLDDGVKNLIFTKTVVQFLTNGLTLEELPRIDVHYTLIGALASSVTPHVQWSLDNVPAFLEHLVHLANTPEIDRKIVRKALILVLRISVVARLHEVDLPTASVPYLETLLHVQAFADNFKMRTIIEDALRLLLRIAPKYNDDRHAVLVNEDDQCLSSGPSAIDGLRTYSKSRDHYEHLPVWAFDLIEDANPNIGKNDGAIDLALFEAYED